MNPAEMLLDQAAAALRSGALTSRHLAQSVLDRIAARPGLDAFTHIAADALGQADAADAVLAAGHDPGPFCGLPVVVKDLIDVAGQPATCGSAVLAGRIADQDATAVARLRAQGAVLIGKVATYEFAMVGPDLTLPAPPARPQPVEPEPHHRRLAVRVCRRRGRGPRAAGAGHGHRRVDPRALGLLRLCRAETDP